MEASGRDVEGGYEMEEAMGMEGEVGDEARASSIERSIPDETAPITSQYMLAWLV